MSARPLTQVQARHPIADFQKFFGVQLTSTQTHRSLMNLQ
jgi:hypothetical protein